MKKGLETYKILLMLVVWIGLVTLMAVWATGCSALQSSNSIDTITIPTAGEQLWKAAKSSNWLVTLSIIGIAGSVFATLNGSKTGIAGIVACSVSLFMALAVARFAWWMALFGLAGSTALVAASIIARKKALVEIIKGIEHIKIAGSDTNLVREGTVNNQLSNNQSAPTQKIVQEIKTDLKLKGEI